MIARCRRLQRDLRAFGEVEWLVNGVANKRICFLLFSSLFLFFFFFFEILGVAVN